MKVLTNSKLDDIGRALVAKATPQTTLRESVRLQGMGLHSGIITSVAIHPAPANSGIAFRDGDCGVAALVENVVDTSRGTTVGNGDIRFRTIEHLMASLSGCGIDNAVVEMHGSETPIMDGSARFFVDAILQAGSVQLDGARKVVTLTEPICVSNGGSFILAVPSNKQRLTYVMNYNHPMIGSQVFDYQPGKDDFETELASARTFVLYEEVAELYENELAKGGSVDNVIVIWRDHMSSDLRWPDELVRHKVMDLVGDISLLGATIQADILAVKSGHAMNAEFTRRVAAMGVWGTSP